MFQVIDVTDSIDKSLAKRLSNWEREWELKPTKHKTLDIIRWLALALCTGGLLYTTYLLLEQAFSGRTVVNIDVRRLDYDVIPAVTVCYPYALSIQGMADRYDELQELYDSYSEIVNGIIDGGCNVDDYYNQEIKQNLENLYHKFEDFFKAQNIPVYEMFDNNLTLQFHTQHQQQETTDRRKGCQTQGPLVYIKVEDIFGSVTDDGDNDNYFITDTDPVVSFVAYRQHNWLKCYTFYSQLSANNSSRWSNLKIHFQSMKLEIRHNDWNYPATLWDDKPYNGIFFNIHSPADMPFGGSYNKFKVLRSGYKYLMSYHTLQTHLLEPPYKTRCQNYDRNSSDGQRTWSDCMYQCFVRQVDDQCRQHQSNQSSVDSEMCHNCLLPSNIYLRQYAMQDKQRNYTLCDEQLTMLTNKELQMWTKRMLLGCDQVCPQECHQWNYMFQIDQKLELTLNDSNIQPSTMLGNNNNNNNMWIKNLEIHIKHNQIPDQVITHVPEMSTVSMISNFGGLIGVWLGLHAYSISCMFLKLWY